MDIDPELFHGQDLAWLRTHQIELRNALSAISVGAEVTIAGRTVRRENYNTVATNLKLVTAEISRQDSLSTDSPQDGSRVSFADFSGG